MYLKLRDIIVILIKQQFDGIQFDSMLIYALIGIILCNMFIYIYTLISHKKISLTQRIFIMLFVVYACFMYMITIEKREPGSRNEIHLMLDFGNLKGDYLQIQQAIYCMLNFVFFVPLGIILSVLQKHKNFFHRVSIVLLQSFLVSMIIEVLQLVTRRGYFETTDIVINTAGGFAGGIIAAVVIALSGMKREEQ